MKFTACNRGSDYELHVVCCRVDEAELKLYTVKPGSWMPPTEGQKLWEGHIITERDCDEFAMKFHATQKARYFVFEMETGG